VWGRTRFVANVPIKARNRYVGILMAFWRTNRTGTFTFFDQDEDYFSLELVGTASGGAGQVIDLPAKETSELAIFINGVLQTPGVNYSVAAGAGSEGRDRVTITAAHTAGHQIRASYMGRHAYTCEFTEAPKRSVSGVGVKSIVFSVREV
jgi:hypothetical protein